MKKVKTRKLIIGGAILAAIIVAVAVIGFILPNKKLPELDTSGALLSVTQNGDTIVFYPDANYAIQGDVEIQGIVFEYEVKSTYKVEDGILVLEDPAPTVSVNSKFGAFEVSGDIYAAIEDGTLVIHLEGSNETSTFELAHFILGKDQAEKINVKGVTADSWEDREEKKTESKEEEKEKEKEVVLDEEGALLSVESAGNKIAFFPDNTFQFVGALTQSDNGLTVDYTIEIKDTYSVKDGKLILPESLTCIWNAELFAEYGKTDVEGPGRCTADIVDGLLEIHFYGTTAGGEIEIARFLIGKEDAEKIGVKGVNGDTVKEEKKTDEENGTSNEGTNNAPTQPAITEGAKPISFSSGGYTITFYSNGQYKESGSVNAGGQWVSVDVTDTYTIDDSGNLQIGTRGQVSCYTSFQGQTLSFGVPNNTSCSPQDGGYLVSFDVFANGQTYHVGSVTLSSGDVKRIQENFGLEGEEPTPEPEEPTPEPEEPTPEPEVPVEDNVIKLTNDSGMTLSLKLDDKSYDISGKTVFSGIELAEYSLVDPAGYSTENNTLSFDPATLKITELNPLASGMGGEYPIQITVAKGENDSLILTLPIGDPFITYSLTKEQAESLGLDMSTYAENPETPEEPGEPENPEENPYIPDSGKTRIIFNNEYEYFTITGEGRFIFNGIEAELSFSVTDTYTIAEGAVSATNTPDALTYTVTYMGAPLMSDAKATPETTIVKEGDNYKVTLKTTVNGQTLTLAEGTVAASEVENNTEATSPYIPDSEKTQIIFNREYGYFTITGEGKFAFNGIEAGLSFSVTDTYAIAEGTVTAANTPDALTYTVTYMGAPLMSDAKATPETTIVKEGENYKVTLKTTVNGQTLTLAEGMVAASEVEPEQAETEDPAVVQTDTALVITSVADVVDAESKMEAESEKVQSVEVVATVPELIAEETSDSSDEEDSDEEPNAEEKNTNE